MPPERKPALEVSLHRKGMGLHEPGSILILRPEQERHAFAIRRVGRWDARDVHRIQRESRRIGIRLSATELRPAANRLLPGTNFFYRGLHAWPRCVGPHEAHQAHAVFFR